MGIGLYAMTCGHLTGDFGRLMEGGEGRIRLPVPAYLIEHPKGLALFDSGMHPDCPNDPAVRVGAHRRTVRVRLSPWRRELPWSPISPCRTASTGATSI